jgi:glycerol-3-phosphate dehydrogenase
VKVANVYGAVVCNYCQAEDFVYEEGKIVGAILSDQLTNQSFMVRSKAVVNAAGPWVDTLRDKDNSKTGKFLHLTKGVHIVVPHEKLPVTQSIYFDVGDGRMIFAIPRGRVTYIGTTDTNYASAIDEVHTEKADAEYLIKATNQTFTNADLQLSDIESSWAGLRPLIHEEGKNASELSRKDEIFESKSGLISIAGGKLTGYRKMAERTVDLVERRYFNERQLQSCLTESILLASSDFKSYKEVKKYCIEVDAKLRALQLVGEAETLVSNFGKQCDNIINRIPKFTDADRQVILAKAQLDFCLEKEMVISAADFFVRRTGLIYFDLPRLKKVMEPCIQMMDAHFQWTSTQLKEEREEMKKLLAEASEF